MVFKKSNKKCGEIKGEEKVQGLEPAVHRLNNDGCKKAIETFLPSVESSLVVRAMQAPGPLQTAQAPALSHVSSLSPGSPLVAHSDDSSSITIGRVTDAPGEVQGFDVALTTSPVQENISMTKNLSVIDSNPMVKQLRDVHGHFSLISPEANPRYERNETVPRHVPRYQINSLTTHFEEEDPSGWKRLLHPEGARYFWYQEKNVYTDANIIDKQIFDQVMDHIDEIFRFCSEFDIKLPAATDLVLVPESEGNERICQYYLVDHANRSIFWLDNLTLSEEYGFYSNVKGVTNPSHIRHEIESQYWYHCHLFPRSFSLTPILVDEFRDIIMHWISDSLTSVTSTSPYPVSELQIMLNLANGFKGTCYP
ncbi:hypothetical protein VKT23_019610 [Stygiomarasmius scandens]|uniref:Uncharacterized protein n=1 Tax=Marasmiellus scandens TaxID=2682957 RepID=A0ABR1IKU2_9AGAR